MRRWIIIILIAISIGIVAGTAIAITQLQGWKFEQDRARYITNAITSLIAIWLTFWLFDLVRAIEQRKRDRNPEKYSAPAATQERDRLSTTTASGPRPPTPATPFSLKQLMGDIRGSLILSLLLVFLDGVLHGSFSYAYMVGSIWFLVALGRGAFGRASPRVAVARILAPVVTGLLIYGNYIIQGHVAMSHAARVIQACECYRQDNGIYPEKLDDLVPRYLSSIPNAKFCFVCNFMYARLQEDTLLWFVDIPPYGRLIYHFGSHEWRGLDG